MKKLLFDKIVVLDIKKIKSLNYLLLNLIKIAIPKNTSKIPTTKSAILIKLVTVELFEFETLAPLPTVDEEVFVDAEAEFVLDVLLVLLFEFAVVFAELLEEALLSTDVFSVKFKSRPLQILKENNTITKNNSVIFNSLAIFITIPFF